MNIEQALRQSLELLTLRVTSARGGYPRHDLVPSDPGAIEDLTRSLAARLPPGNDDICMHDGIEDASDCPRAGR